MTYQCEIVERPALHAASIRTRAAVQELPKVLGEGFASIMQHLCERGAPPAGAPFTGYFNMDMNDLDLEIGVPVAEPIAGNAHIQPSSIPAGRFATCLHIGPYQAVEQAYTALMGFCREQGLELCGAAYEFYLNDPNATPEDKLETLVTLPVK